MIFWSAFFLFIANKFFIRPWIVEADLQGFVAILSYSVPNFIEAVFFGDIIPLL